MLFKPYLIDLILAGQKTQTRRAGEVQRYKVGHVYRCCTNYYSKGGPRIRIAKAWRQKIGDVSAEEARAEGFRDRQDFYLAWAAINGGYDPHERAFRASTNEEVWAYEFELAGDAAEEGDVA